jgi:hypothetical protein
LSLASIRSDGTTGVVTRIDYAFVLIRPPLMLLLCSGVLGNNWLQTPVQDTGPLLKIELVETDTRRVAGRRGHFYQADMDLRAGIQSRQDKWT